MLKKTRCKRDINIRTRYRPVYHADDPQIRTMYIIGNMDGNIGPRKLLEWFLRRCLEFFQLTLSVFMQNAIDIIFDNVYYYRTLYPMWHFIFLILSCLLIGFDSRDQSEKRIYLLTVYTCKFSKFTSYRILLLFCFYVNIRDTYKCFPYFSQKFIFMLWSLSI